MLATGANSASSHKPLSAEAFFDVLHPSHDRNPAWPDRLTLDIDATVTLSEFKSLLMQHRWRTRYDCDGRPAKANPILFDGLSFGVIETTFDERTFTRFESATPQRESNSQTATYEVAAMGEGRFKITFLTGGFSTQPVRVGRVRETGERILVHDKSHQNICPGATDIRVLRVPTEVPAF